MTFFIVVECTLTLEAAELLVVILYAQRWVVVDTGNFGILIAGGGGDVIGVTLLVIECTDGDLLATVTGGTFYFG